MERKPIKMQYPYDPTNPYYDGKEHLVTPIFYVPIEIGGNKFFIMKYYDHHLNSEMITLVINIGNQLLKVPLNEKGYELLNKYLENYKGKLYYCKAQAIGLTKGIHIDNLESPYRFYFFVPRNEGGMTSVGSCTYTSNSVVGSNGIRTHNFIKEPLYRPIADGLQYGLNKCNIGMPLPSMPNNYKISPSYYNDKNVLTYHFFIDIPKGATVEETIIGSDNKARVVLLQMIPGKYLITGYYSDFTEKDYEQAKETKELKIVDEKESYNGIKDQPVVFRDGGAGLLPMYFDDELDKKNYR